MCRSLGMSAKPAIWSRVLAVVLVVAAFLLVMQLSGDRGPAEGSSRVLLEEDPSDPPDRVEREHEIDKGMPLTRPGRAELKRKGMRQRLGLLRQRLELLKEGGLGANHPNVTQLKEEIVELEEEVGQSSE